LLALTPTDALQLHDRMSDCRMVILAVGSTPITELDAIQSIDVVHGLVPDAPIVILSDRDESAEVVAALEAGVQGFIPSTMTPELALQTLSFIMSGGTYFPASAIRHSPNQPTHEDGPAVNRMTDNGVITDSDDVSSSDNSGAAQGAGEDPNVVGASLTTRQQQVLLLLREGQRNKVIARRLNMAEATVKVHVRQILRKFGATNRTEAALCATGVGGAVARLKRNR
jgi:DNA-binding NarL/FixJ family response regulator